MGLSTGKMNRLGNQRGCLTAVRTGGAAQRSRAQTCSLPAPVWRQQRETCLALRGPARAPRACPSPPEASAPAFPAPPQLSAEAEATAAGERPHGAADEPAQPGPAPAGWRRPCWPALSPRAKPAPRAAPNALPQPSLWPRPSTGDKVEPAQSCWSLSRVRLFVTPRTVARQAPLCMEFSREEYWSGWPFPSPGDLPSPGIEPMFLPLQADS